MTLFEKITLTSAIIAFTGYLFQILMIIGCCDKHIKLQVNVFRVTLISILITIISYVLTFFVK